MTDQERQIVQDWINDPQVAVFSKAAAEVIARWLKEAK